MIFFFFFFLLGALRLCVVGFDDDSVVAVVVVVALIGGKVPPRGNLWSAEDGMAPSRSWPASTRNLPFPPSAPPPKPNVFGRERPLRFFGAEADADPEPVTKAPRSRRRRRRLADAESFPPESMPESMARWSAPEPGTTGAAPAGATASELSAARCTFLNCCWSTVPLAPTSRGRGSTPTRAVEDAPQPIVRCALEKRRVRAMLVGFFCSAEYFLKKLYKKPPRYSMSLVLTVPARRQTPSQNRLSFFS
jgi:hypothetical protein